MGKPWLLWCGLALAIAAAACSDAPVSFEDAGPDGGGPDGGDPDGAPDGGAGDDDVTVHVRTATGDGAPDPDATVVHAAADGTVLATMTPDATGTARFPVTPGDSVTVGHSMFPLLTTVVGVEPGDELWFGSPSFRPIGSMTVTVPSHAGASGYELRGPCVSAEASTSPQLTVLLRDGCPATRTVVVAAIGAGAAGGELTFAAQLTPASGTTATLSGAYAAPIDVTATVQGIAADAGATYTGALVMSGHVTTPVVLAHDEPTNAVAWRRPATLDEGIYVTAEVTDPDDESVFRAATRVMPGAPTIDLARRVPTITGVTTSPALAWTVSEETPLDGFVVRTALRGGKGEASAIWLFIVPPDARALVRPQLTGAPDTRVEELVVTDVAGLGYDELRSDASFVLPLAALAAQAGHDLQSWSVPVVD